MCRAIVSIWREFYLPRNSGQMLILADFRLYLLTFTKAANVCDSTVTPMTISCKKTFICKVFYGLTHHIQTMFWNFYRIAYMQRRKR